MLTPSLGLVSKALMRSLTEIPFPSFLSVLKQRQRILVTAFQNPYKNMELFVLLRLIHAYVIV